MGRLSVAGVGTREGPPALPTDAANADYLEADIANRLCAGPIAFEVVVQQPGPSDVIDDISAPWSGPDTPIVLGEIRLDGILPQAETEAQAFDPGRLPRGVLFAGDPMIADRVLAYRIAAARRLQDR